MSFTRPLAAAALLAATLASPGAHAALTTLASFTGAGYGVSTSGCGSTLQSCTLQANVPVGATILKAYLYTTVFSDFQPIGGTFNSTPVTYTMLPGVFPGLHAGRADVTALLTGGGPYTVTETAEAQDGSALVVVYADPTVSAVRTVGVLDGASDFPQSTATFQLDRPVDTSLPGFRAELRLGIGFSSCRNRVGEQSQGIDVNGITVSEEAGCSDDSVDPVAENGSLITVGDDADPLSLLLPAGDTDHERYDISALLKTGDMSIDLRIRNQQADDNAFLAVFQLSADGPATVPEPVSLALAGLGLLGMGAQRARRRVQAASNAETTMRDGSLSCTSSPSSAM